MAHIQLAEDWNWLVHLTRGGSRNLYRINFQDLQERTSLQDHLLVQKGQHGQKADYAHG